MTRMDDEITALGLLTTLCESIEINNISARRLGVTQEWVDEAMQLCTGSTMRIGGVVDAEREPTTNPHCSRCGTSVNATDGSWRYCDGRWEHKCPDAHPQSGHFAAE